jgi:hypothetical protein
MWRAGAAALSIAAAAVLACDRGAPAPSSPTSATPATRVVTSRPCDVVTVELVRSPTVRHNAGST